MARNCEFHFHFHNLNSAEIMEELKALRVELKLFKEEIMTTQVELAADLATVVTEVQKIGAETQTLIGKVTELEAVIAAGGPVTPEVAAALQAVKDQLKIVDDLVPDAPPAP